MRDKLCEWGCNVTINGVYVWVLLGEGETTTGGGRRKCEVSEPLFVIVEGIFDFVVCGFLKDVSGNEMCGKKSMMKFDLVAKLTL